jgi:NADP-dependent 3-hydroxy acid dehydrogenase YdfG
MVILIDVNKVGGETKAAENENVYFVHGDVTQKETWEEAVALGRKEHGRVDLIVNNAGMDTHERDLKFTHIFIL